MKRDIKLVMLLAIVGIVFVNMVQAAPIITMVPDSANIYVGQEFKIQIRISDEDIINSTGWNGRIVFDPEYFSFQEAAGAFNPDQSLFEYNNPAPGNIMMINYNMLLNTVSGQGMIADITFIPKRWGASLIDFTNFTFSDPAALSIPVVLDSGLNILISQNPVDMDGDNDIDGIDLVLFANAYGEGAHLATLEFFAESYPLF